VPLVASCESGRAIVRKAREIISTSATVGSVPQTPAGRSSRRLTTRGLIAAGVLTAHIAVLAPSVLTPFRSYTTMSLSSSTAIEVILLPPATRPPTPVAPTVRRIKLRTPPLPEVVAKEAAAGPGNAPGTLVSRDEPHSPPFERLIAEASPEDATSLHRFCDDSFPASSRLSTEQGTVVLLVRIESDGHVSDTTVEESSGSPRLDRVTQACVMAGSFEPTRTGWRTTASWQRVHWNWSKQ